MKSYVNDLTSWNRDVRGRGAAKDWTLTLPLDAFHGAGALRNTERPPVLLFESGKGTYFAVAVLWSPGRVSPPLTSLVDLKMK